MNIREFIRHLTPGGTNGFAGYVPNSAGADDTSLACPTWPPDLFAIAGSIIEHSGCYTLATPDRAALADHGAFLDKIIEAAQAWNRDCFHPPGDVVGLWDQLVNEFGTVDISAVCKNIETVRCLLALFAIADEASIGAGWDVTDEEVNERTFAALVMGSMAYKGPDETFMVHLPHSLCCAVAPDKVIVLPKANTATVGCTIRSLSHYLALLPPASILEPSWTWTSTTDRSTTKADAALPYDVRLLLVPFPYTVHADSFQLNSGQEKYGSDYNIPAYFSVVQRWLDGPEGEGAITGERMARDLFLPLIHEALAQSGDVPNGIVLPECALSTIVAEQLVYALKDSGIEFLITGVLDVEPETGKAYNRAQTFVMREGEEGAVLRQQGKHHRWRLDKSQVDRYALNFDQSHDNDQWWEDIEVDHRQLPFIGLRKDMSITTLICEDLARADPAMGVIRSVGPNLVIALLMDGPQLAVRWPGRYATVLAEDPGSAVLSFTCSGMVDRSNWVESRPANAIGLWRDAGAGGRTQEIGLPQGSLGILLTLVSAKKRQTTLDGRSDKELARKLTLRNIVPLFLANRPKWI